MAGMEKVQVARGSRVSARLLPLFLAILVVATACGQETSTGGSGGELVLRVNYYTGLIAEQPFAVADQEGFFKKHGVRVERLNIANGPAAMAALSGGSIDVASASPDVMVAGSAGGLQLQWICSASGPLADLVSKSIPAGSYPDVMKGVVGKRIGVSVVGGGLQFLVEALLEGAGLSKDSVTFVGVGNVTAIAPFEQGRIDADVAIEPVLSILKLKDGAHTVISFRKNEGPPLLHDLRVGLAYFAKRDFIQSHAKALDAFARALEEAHEFAANPANFDRVMADVLAESALDVDTLPGGREGFRSMIQDNIAANNVTAFTNETATAWVTYMQKYQVTVLRAYASQSPAAVVAGKIWSGGCQK